MKRLGVPGLAILMAGLLAGAAPPAEPEKDIVQVGVPGVALPYSLPLTIAQEEGFFADQGLTVDVSDFQGGSKSLQALVDGSVDVVVGAYEHTVRMQAKGQDIVAVIELGRYPGFVLAVRKTLEDTVKTAADLKGMTVGVSSTGGSTHNFLNCLLAKDGATPDAVSAIGVGTGETAIAAIKEGRIDALVGLDPAISALDRDGDISVVVDGRTDDGTVAIFGTDDVPAAVLYTKRQFVEANPKTVQALVNAFAMALDWLDTASPEDVVATVPESYFLYDKALYSEAIRNSLPAYSHTGLVTAEGMKSALALLSFDPEIANADIDLGKTFDPNFVENVPKK